MKPRRQKMNQSWRANARRGHQGQPRCTRNVRAAEGQTLNVLATEGNGRRLCDVAEVSAPTTVAVTWAYRNQSSQQYAVNLPNAMCRLYLNLKKKNRGVPVARCWRCMWLEPVLQPLKIPVSSVPKPASGSRDFTSPGRFIIRCF